MRYQGFGCTLTQARGATASLQGGSGGREWLRQGLDAEIGVSLAPHPPRWSRGSAPGESRRIDCCSVKPSIEEPSLPAPCNGTQTDLRAAPSFRAAGSPATARHQQLSRERTA